MFNPANLRAVYYWLRANPNPVVVVMAIEQANEAARHFLTGEWKLRNRPVAGDVDCPGPWAVRLEEVAAVQVLPYQAAAQGAAPPTAPGLALNPFNRSGI